MDDIKGYPITPELFKKLRKSKLTKHEIIVWLYLNEQDSLQDKSYQFPSLSEIIEELEMSKASYFRALKVLHENELLPAWCKNYYTLKNNIETTIRNRMKEELGGAVEVVTPVGRIDLLTSIEIIEIKEINDWKEALGKLLAYSSFFPEHSKRIHLFGHQDKSKLDQATAMCRQFNITVTFEEV